MQKTCWLESKGKPLRYGIDFTIEQLKRKKHCRLFPSYVLRNHQIIKRLEEQF